MMKIDKVCENCRFFVVSHNKYNGDCRRYPPVADLESNYQGIFPKINSFEIACGEYKPKEELLKPLDKLAERMNNEE